MFCLGLTANIQAQNAKIGHVNIGKLSETLQTQMPEYKAAQDSLEAFQKDLQEQFEKMELENQRKVKEYEDAVKAGKPEAILEIIKQEVIDIQTRMQKFQETAQQAAYQKNEELLGPIRKKLDDAIKAVAAEGKYTYILDSSDGGPVLYGMESQDVSEKIKAKLGL